MVTQDAARLMRVPGYGVQVGAPADLVLLDASSARAAVAELAQPLWGMKAGRITFERSRPRLYDSAAASARPGGAHEGGV